MAHTLTLEIPDVVYQPLAMVAEQVRQAPEALALQWLATAAQKVADDPLLALAGTLECEVTDVGERHDAYIGQGLLTENGASSTARFSLSCNSAVSPTR